MLYSYEAFIYLLFIISTLSLRSIFLICPINRFKRFKIFREEIMSIDVRTFDTDQRMVQVFFIVNRKNNSMRALTRIFTRINLFSTHQQTTVTIIIYLTRYESCNYI